MKKMPNILVRLSLLFHLFHSFILFLLPSTTTPPHEEDDTTTKNTQIKNNNNKKRPNNLQQVFDAFDGDKDGLITRHELSVSLRRMGIAISDADLASLIETADVNGDGCVDAREFEAMYLALAGAEGEEGEEKQMEEAFAVFDRDGDGFISEEELKGVLESLGMVAGGRGLEECRRMIERVDEDGDGRVSFSEFKAMMKGVGGLC